MQNCDIKQRQKSLKKPQSAEKSPATGTGTERRSASDVKLPLVCLAVSVIISWILLQQRAKLAEMTDKYELLYERSRRVQELETQMRDISQRLQASTDAATQLAELTHAVASIRNTTVALTAEQDTASDRLLALTDRLRSAAETGGGRAVASDELNALKTRTRAAHGRVTESVNDIDGLLRGLSERLQEVEDGIKRNTRVLDRTEEEDAQRVRDWLDLNTRRLWRLQEQLRRLSALGLGHQEKLETSAPQAQRWQETHLPAAEESVRSMLRLRAQVSGVHRRLQELTLQVRSAEEHMMRSTLGTKINSGSEEDEQERSGG